MEYKEGTKIPSMPGWEIVRELGSGSYGTVFEVQKKNFEVTAKAAVKLIRIPKSVSEIREAMSEGMDEQSVTTYFEGIVKRFVKEIAVMSELKSHPNIVACEDYVVESHAENIGWDILIRMELLTTLTNYQLKNPMNEETVKCLAMDICEALVFCQKKGLIHRDIKPANIFVDENDRFKLGDFGVARTAEKTMGGYSKQGTENYMAPEVYLGRPYGATVDIYSLGLVLYRLMNGNRLPFYPAAPKQIEFSDRENALVTRMRGDVMPPPCNASEEFATIILKACAYDSKNRYRTAAEMLEALKNLEKKSSESVLEQKSTNEMSGPEGQFGRVYFIGEDGKRYDKEIWISEEEGSVGIDFGKIKKENKPTTEVDEQAKDSEEKADDSGDNIEYQDEKSMGSIGIVWGKKTNDEMEETETVEESKDDAGTNVEHVEEKKEENNSNKMRSTIIKAIGAVVGVFIIVMLILAFCKEKKSTDSVSETENIPTALDSVSETENIPTAMEAIRIGVLDPPEHVPNPWTYEGDVPAIEAAWESRPTVVIDNVKYPVELVYYNDNSSVETTNYQSAAEYFKENECSAIISIYSDSSERNDIVTRLDIPIFENYIHTDYEPMVFTLKVSKENFAYLQAKFILDQIPEAEYSNRILVLYDEQESNLVNTLEDRNMMITALEACGGEVVYASVSDQTQLEAALLENEYGMIYAGLLYGNVMAEDVLIARDKLSNETMPGLIVPDVPVIVKWYGGEMLNKYDNTYDLNFEWNSEFFNIILDKTEENGVSDRQMLYFSAYYLILDALETNEGLVTALKNDEFEGAFGNVTFDENNQAIYDSIDATHTMGAGTQPEHLSYKVEE